MNDVANISLRMATLQRVTEDAEARRLARLCMARVYQRGDYQLEDLRTVLACLGIEEA